VSDDEQTVHKGDALQTRFIAAKAKTRSTRTLNTARRCCTICCFSVTGSCGGPVMATPAQMLELVDSPAFFERGTRTAAETLTPVKLQKYRIDYGVIDPQLKVEAKRSALRRSSSLPRRPTTSMGNC